MPIKENGQIRSRGWLLWLSAGVLMAVTITLYRSDLIESVISRQLQNEQLLMNWHTSGRFLIYLLICRGFPFYLLMILSVKTGLYFFFNLYFLYCGFIYGVQAVLFAVQYQWNGLLFCAVQTLPQLLFYLPSLYLGYGSLKNKNRYDRYNNPGSRVIIFIFILWSAGVLAECYLNPLFMQVFMKIFL